MRKEEANAMYDRCVAAYQRGLSNRRLFVSSMAQYALDEISRERLVEVLNSCDTRETIEGMAIYMLSGKPMLVEHNYVYQEGHESFRHDYLNIGVYYQGGRFTTELPNRLMSCHEGRVSDGTNKASDQA